MSETDELRNRRLKHNELLFREINDVRDATNPDGDSYVLAFLCECSDPNCTQRIELAAGTYEAIRAQPARFVLRPGHEDPTIERVVETGPDYEVVQKYAA